MAGPDPRQPAIIVHSLDHAQAAARAATILDVPLVLMSPAGGVGGGWLAALGAILAERFPALALTVVLDCADEAGTVLGAFRRGLKHVRFTGPAPARARLQAIADAQGATLEADDRPSLDLSTEIDAETACRIWLARNHGA